MLTALRFASATAYFFVISGWLMLAAFFGPRKFRLLDTLALSFLTSVAAASLLAAAAHLLGLPLDAVLLMHLAISIAAGIDIATRRRGASDSVQPLSSRDVRWEIAAAIIAASAAVLSWVEGLWLRMSDLFYHVAAVASLLTYNQPLVTDPFFFNVRYLPVDPTAGTFHTFLALAARLGGITAFQSFEWLEPVVTLLYFLAFYAFARKMLCSAPKAVFALALFAVVIWSLDYRVIVYSKWIVPAVAWIGLLFFIMLLERFDWRALFFTCLFASTTALVHLSAGELWVFIVAASVAWSLIFMRWIEDGRGVAARCALGAGASMLALAPVVYRRSVSVLVGAETSVFNPPAGSPMSGLPYLPLGPNLGIIRGGTWYQWYQGGDFMLAFVALSLVLLTIQVVRRGGKPQCVVQAALTSIMPLLMLNLVGTKLLLTKYWFHLRRLAYSLRALPALLLPWTAGATRDEVRARGPKWLVVLCVVTLGFGILAFAGIEVIGVFGRFVNPMSLDNFGRQRHNVVVQMDGLTRYLQANTQPTYVVAANEKTSYYLAGLVPVHVLAVRRPHMPLAVEVQAGPSRRADQAQILSPKVTVRKTLRLLEKYQVAYVVAPAGSPVLAKFDGIPKLERTYADSRFVVYHVVGFKPWSNWRQIDIR